MASKKNRTRQEQIMIDAANEQLARDDRTYPKEWDEKRKQAYRIGIADILTTFLSENNSYRGFRYLVNPNTPREDGSEFDESRRYYF